MRAQSSVICSSAVASCNNLSTRSRLNGVGASHSVGHVWARPSSAASAVRVSVLSSDAGCACGASPFRRHPSCHQGYPLPWSQPRALDPFGHASSCKQSCVGRQSPGVSSNNCGCERLGALTWRSRVSSATQCSVTTPRVSPPTLPSRW